MAVKNVLPVYHAVVAASMTGNITSPVTDVRLLDNICYQLQWTGTPTGTFAVQVSSDYTTAPGGAIANAGTWIPLVLSSTITASGAADQVFIDLNQIPAPYIRLVYTAGSSTGTLDVYISGKAT